VAQVPAVRTQLTPEAAIDAIWHAHQDVVGGPCPIPLLEILAAQSSLETAQWHSMWNWNFGNIRGKGDQGNSMSIRGANEVDGGKVVTGPGVEAGFAAYSDAMEGARAFVRFLCTASHPPHPNRYQTAIYNAEAGDVVGYCRELRQQGYFTASLSSYTAGVQACLGHLRMAAIPAFLESLNAGKDTDPPTAA
jgi:hypothetical protein